jgi:hypothetical protein
MLLKLNREWMKPVQKEESKEAEAAARLLTP